MAGKPHKREFKIWHRQIAKVQARKFNRPIFGRVESLEEQNRSIINKLASQLTK